MQRFVLVLILVIFLFLILYFFFFFIQSKYIKRKILKKEISIKDGGATDLSTGSGGWLYLTPNFLYFRAHHLNSKIYNKKWELKSIKDIEVGSGINEFLLYINNSSSPQKFIVFNRKKWIKSIKDAKTD